MKIKVLGFVFGLIVGLIVGSCCIGFVWFFKEARHMFDPVSLSTQEILDRIENEVGFMIPQSAADIRYYRIISMDPENWFAFSDKADAISDFIKHHSFVVSEKTETRHPRIYNDKNYKEEWWPKSFENCEFYKTTRAWMAYDRVNGRVYIHFWS